MAIGTTAAILGSAALGLAGSAMSAGAASKAAKAQAEAADKAAQVQRDMATQARIDAYPWALQGAQALYTYMDQLGIPRPQTPILPDLTQGPLGTGGQTAQTGTQAQQNPPANRPAANELFNYGMRGMDTTYGGYAPNAVTPAAQPAANAIGAPSTIPMTQGLGFTQTPGYQFRVQQGEQGVLNNLSALGMKNSGKALKALESFRQGIASDEYNNWLNRIAGVAGMGQTQTNQTNALSMQAASNMGNAYQDAGQARASGYIGAANAWSNGFNQVGNALGRLAV